ncbi:hypothetical protein EWB00_003594 [Schistosoma japonicum]|uniref:Uncharacterized protein n=1 Tax=Schistosoma japonicum TaxID=6182 RepID=A0A4Z2D7Z6_SCHJA|nr:hypothetical protein EWB00_003594 [Schistosoma japonicum]
MLLFLMNPNQQQISIKQRYESNIPEYDLIYTPLYVRKPVLSTPDKLVLPNEIEMCLIYGI